MIYGPGRRFQSPQKDPVLQPEHVSQLLLVPTGNVRVSTLVRAVLISAFYALQVRAVLRAAFCQELYAPLGFFFSSAQRAEGISCSELLLHEVWIIWIECILIYHIKNVCEVPIDLSKKSKFVTCMFVFSPRVQFIWTQNSSIVHNSNSTSIYISKKEKTFEILFWLGKAESQLSCSKKALFSTFSQNSNARYYLTRYATTKDKTTIKT